MDASVSRYDFAPITRSETTPEGYLRVWCRAARTGTQLYRRADGSQVREYRPPEEVGKPETLATFGMKPVTWTHPPVLLDSTNTGQFSKGTSGSHVNFSDGFVEVALVVTDADIVEKIKRKEATEVSAGYKVDFDPTPGFTPEGESYDGVQRNIRVNHIAIVPRGRAGPEVRLLLDRMDAADAVAEPSGATDRLSNSPASPLMATVKLDGLEIDLPAEAATAVQSFARDTGRALQDAQSQNEDLLARIDELEAAIDTLATEKEAAEGRADALEEALTKSGGTSSDRIDTAELDQLVTARLATLQRLAPAFDPDFKFDGIGEDELYAVAYENITGEAPSEDAPEDYIRGIVDGTLLSANFDSEDDEEDDESDEDEDLVDDEDERGDSVDYTSRLSSALRGATRRDAASPTVAYRQRISEGWKRPLTATK